MSRIDNIYNKIPLQEQWLIGFRWSYDLHCKPHTWPTLARAAPEQTIIYLRKLVWPEWYDFSLFRWWRLYCFLGWWRYDFELVELGSEETHDLVDKIELLLLILDHDGSLS